MNIQLPMFGIPFVGALNLAGLVTAISIVVHVMFAIGLYAEAKRLDGRNRTVRFVAPWVWSLAVLSMGLPVIAFYWLIHMSPWSGLRQGGDDSTQTAVAPVDTD